MSCSVVKNCCLSLSFVDGAYMEAIHVGDGLFGSIGMVVLTIRMRPSLSCMVSDGIMNCWRRLAM